MMQSQSKNTSGGAGNTSKKEDFYMTRTARIEEMMVAMKSFGKEKYHRTEVLPELLSLQRELVTATPWDDVIDVNDLKL